MAKPLAASGGVDQQQPQLGDIVAVPHQKYRADLRSLDVRNPAAFSRSVERTEKPGRNLGDKSLNEESKPYSQGVERAVALHHPSHVAGARLAQRRRRRQAAGFTEQSFDTAIAPIKRALPSCGNVAQHRSNLIMHAAVEFCERLTSLGCHSEPVLPAVGRQRFAVINPASSKFCTIRLR